MAQRHTLGDDLRQYRTTTAWGDLLIASRGSIVCGVRPPGCRVPAGMIEPVEAAPPTVRRLADALSSYFDGSSDEPLASREELGEWLDAAGVTGFRRDVSLALFDVPPAVTISYGELAALAGRPGAARAAGSACARNPLPIVVPCHRVVHAAARKGDVGRYGADLPDGAGSEMKRRLLELEGATFVTGSGSVAASGT